MRCGRRTSNVTSRLYRKDAGDGVTQWVLILAITVTAPDGSVAHTEQVNDPIGDHRFESRDECMHIGPALVPMYMMARHDLIELAGSISVVAVCIDPVSTGIEERV